MADLNRSRWRELTAYGASWPFLLALVLLLGTGPGCGASTGVVITMESSYKVPEQVDGINVEVSGAGQASKFYDIDVNTAFPQSFAVVVDKLSGTITITVTATKGGTMVTQAQIRADLVADQMLDYIIDL